MSHKKEPHRTLELKQEGSWLKRLVNSKHNQKTIFFTLIGAIGGGLYFYFTEGKQMEAFAINEMLRSAFFGGFLGFFVTNSPCARGRC